MFKSCIDLLVCVSIQNTTSAVPALAKTATVLMDSTFIHALVTTVTPAHSVTLKLTSVCLNLALEISASTGSIPIHVSAMMATLARTVEQK